MKLRLTFILFFIFSLIFFNLKAQKEEEKVIKKFSIKKVSNRLVPTFKGQFVSVFYLQPKTYFKSIDKELNPLLENLYVEMIKNRDTIFYNGIEYFEKCKKIMGEKEAKKYSKVLSNLVGKTNGTIEKNRIYNVGVGLFNFNYEIDIEVVDFTIAASIGGYYEDANWLLTKDENTKNGQLTKKQKEIVNKLRNGNRIYLEDMIIRQLDGSTLKLFNISYLIK